MSVKKSNLDLYRNVSEFKSNVKTEQKIELKLAESDMLMQNVKEHLKIQHDELERLRNDCFSYCKNDDLKRSDERFTCSLNEIKQLLDTEYITQCDLEAFSENVEKTMQDFIVQSTPRTNNEVIEQLNSTVGDLVKKVDVLYEKNSVLKRQYDELLTRLESCKGHYIDPLCLEQVEQSIILPTPLEKKTSSRSQIVPNLTVKRKSEFKENQ